MSAFFEVGLYVGLVFGDIVFDKPFCGGAGRVALLHAFGQGGYKDALQLVQRGFHRVAARGV